MGKNTVRKRKIHFHGNRYTKKQNIETQNEQEATSSSSRAKKLKDSINYSTSIVDELDQDDYYLNLFLNFKILKETLQPQGLLLSPECHQPTVNFVNNQEARIGFVNKLTISCDICDWEKNFYTSKQCTRPNKKQGRNMFEINVQAIVAF